MHRRSCTVFIAIAVVLVISASAQPQEVGTAPPPESGNKFPLSEATAIETTVAATGTLTVQALQGTSGTQPVGAAPVRVQLYSGNQMFRTLDGRLDEESVVTFPDLPLDVNARALVLVSHSGVTYTGVGPVMDAAHPEARVIVMCYDATEEAPDWTVKMRHVMIDHHEHGVTVNEVIVVNNPTDRTWVGTVGADDKRVTTTFPVPMDAHSFALGRGFNGWNETRRENGKLINQLPLMPETTEMQFAYVLTTEDGKASLDITSPARAERLMVVLPTTLQVETPEGLEDTGAQPMGDREVRSFVGGAMDANETLQIRLTGLTDSMQAQETAAASGNMARWIALIGGGLIVLIALIVLFSRSPKAGAS